MKSLAKVSSFLSKKTLILGLLLLPGFFQSCSSYQQFEALTNEIEIPNKIFRSDFAETWQAVLVVMKGYDLELQNQEAGIIKTRWIDNTLEQNFADSFGSADSVKSARFKLLVNVIKGFRGSKEVTKVTVFKRQMVNQDFLTGWRLVPTDHILESSILYRVERTLSINNKLKEIEDQKSKEAEAGFN
jgi:hypothetical protein